MGPFAAAAVLGLVTLAIPPANADKTLVVIAVVSTAAIVVSAVTMPWRRFPSWLQAVPPLAYFAVVAIQRDAAGGATSGYSPLVVIPFLWLSLHGTRLLLMVATVAVAAVLVGPIVLEGGPEYPTTEWRRAIIWLSILPTVGFTVRSLVERVEHLSQTDSLTGLLNRRAWDDQLQQALARARRLNQPLSLAILDLDHFKGYNDTHGHVAGDRLLRAVADAWGDQVRDIDVVARYGGEEFGVVMPATTMDEADTVVGRLLGSVPDGQTASAGIAEWNPGEDVTAFLHRADEAMYRAKREGRNRSRRAPAVTADHGRLASDAEVQARTGAPSPNIGDPRDDGRLG